MKRSMGILLLPVILLLLASDVLAAEILTNDSIIQMVKAGLGQELILGKIKISQHQFDLSTNGLLRLKKEGVSETIIKGMLDAAARSAPAGPSAGQAAAPQGESGPAEQEAIALYRQGKAAEAVAAFDRLLVEKPNDDRLKIWKALALLEQAREVKESKGSGHKPLVVEAYRILQPLGRRQVANPDWNFAMAKAFWLNERPERADRVAKRVLTARPNFAEAYLLLGDIAYEEELSPPASPPGGPRNGGVRWQRGLAARKEYEAALALPDLTSALRAEALYKLGMVAADLENKKETARDYWEQASSAAPDSRYGRMAQQRLGGQSTK